MQALVSVVVPVYNAEKYIKFCIESLLNQSYTSLEILLINDGSTDSSRDICLNFQLQDSRIKYFEHKNQGVSYTRNVGLLKSTGKYITFVDSDDLLEQNAIEKMVEAIEKNTVDLVVSSYKILSDELLTEVSIEPFLCRDTLKVADYFVEHFLEGIASSVWGKLYKREKIDKYFTTDLTMGEDLLFNLQYIKSINSVVSIPNSLYVYNKNNDSSLVQNYKPSYFKQIFVVCLEWLEYAEKNEVTGSSLRNIYYRVSSSLFDLIEFSVARDTIKYLVLEMHENGTSITKFIYESIDKYNFLQRMIFTLLIKGDYRECILLGKLYFFIRAIKNKMRG